MAVIGGNTLGEVKSKGSIYFRNLNSLRFIAVMMVFVHHIEQLKHLYVSRIPEFNIKQIQSTGVLGVRLFFVLSGFLITYLLFMEQEKSGTISVRKFYIRRALRIWPLYYLIILLSFLILPNIHSLYPPAFTGYTLADLPKTLVPYLFFFPNLVLFTYGIVMFASHTWSIGTEEQFYVIWPLLFKKVKNKLVLLVSIVVFYIIMKHVLARLPAGYISEMLVFYWSQFPIDNMAIGGLFAMVIYKQEPFFVKIRNLIFNRYFQAATYIAVVCSIVFCIYIPDVVFEYYCVLFGIIIVNLAANKNSLCNMETPVLKYLGKISYGLYIYHPLTIAIMIRAFGYFGCTSNLLYYPLTLALTILLAGLSYEFFESRFIKQKKAYSVVVSGDNTAAGEKDS